MTERYPEHYAAQPASYSQQPQPAPYPQPHAQPNSLQPVDSAQPQRVMPDPGVTYPVQQATPPQQVRGTNVMSILSLVFAFVFAPLGIVFGISPRSRSAGPARAAAEIGRASCRESVDLGGRRIIKKKKKKKKKKSKNTKKKKRIRKHRERKHRQNT